MNRYGNQRYKHNQSACDAVARLALSIQHVRYKFPKPKIPPLKKEKAAKAKATPFNEIITKRRLPFIEGNRRNQKAVATEIRIYKLWLKPVIGHLPLPKIAQRPPSKQSRPG